MGSGSDIRIEGLARAVRQLERLGVRLEDLREAFSRIASEAAPIYQRFTPRKTGRLRGDYRPGKTKNRVVLYVGRASVPYAGAINYGWAARGIQPANYVAKGDVVAAPRALDAVEANIEQLIRSMT